MGGRQGGGEGRWGGEGGEGGGFDLKDQGLKMHPIERNLAIARVTPASFASFRDFVDLYSKHTKPYVK